MLLFKARFREDILSGRKRTTLRAWRTPRARAGTVRRTNLGIDLYIEEVCPLALADITDEVAREDGFDDAGALLATLRELYPALPATLTLVRFRTA